MAKLFPLGFYLVGLGCLYYNLETDQHFFFIFAAFALMIISTLWGMAEMLHDDAKEI